MFALFSVLFIITTILFSIPSELMLAVKDNRQWGNILSADKKLTMCSITKQVLDGIRSILPAELAQFLQSERPAVEQLSSGEVMLLDCRSFMAYNLQHIAGALNVNCTGIVKKRLQQGKLSLGDVVTPETGKDLIKSGKWHRAVVYDDSTSELDKIPASHTIRLVLGAVLSQGKEALLLKGGIKEFSQVYKNLVLVKSEQRSVQNGSGSPSDLSEEASKLNIHTPNSLASVPATQILPFLYLGNYRDAESEEFFDTHNVKYVLNLTCNCPNYFSSRKDLSYKQVKIEDTCQENILKVIMEALDFIDSARQNGSVVLVHCQGGVSRSATTAVAYLMYHMKLSLKDAYKFVKDKRPCIAPNLNFMGQLMEFERQIKDVKLSIGTEL